MYMLGDQTFFGDGDQGEGRRGEVQLVICYEITTNSAVHFRPGFQSYG